MICTLRDMLRLSLQRCYVVVAMLLLPASSLSAAVVIFHAELKSSVPSAGAHLGVVPRELRLTFTEAPELGFSTVSLVGPGGSAVLLGPVRVASDSRMSITATVPAALAAGTYTVKWKIVGADGHRATLLRGVVANLINAVSPTTLVLLVTAKVVATPPTAF